MTIRKIERSSVYYQFHVKGTKKLFKVGEHRQAGFEKSWEGKVNLFKEGS